MANLDQPMGAKPYGDILRINPYTANAAIYPGDFVTMADTGLVGPASAGGAICGVAASYASGSGVEVMVWDHPDQKFVVQSDDSTIDAQTDVGLNYEILATAGDATYKCSRMELDGSTGAVTATINLRLLGINREVNNALGANVDCIVLINTHQLRPGSVGL